MRLPRLACAAFRKFRNDRRASVLHSIPGDATCAEIGVWKGEFSERIKAAARPRALHLIDPWRFVAAYPARWYGGAAARNQEDMDRIHRDVVSRFAGDPRVIVHRLESRSAAESLADTVFDWVYIDGDHSYEAVRDDLKVWASRLKPGGLLTGDDYTWRDEAGACPVKRAVQEFVARQSPRDVTIDGDQFILRL